MTIAEDEHAIIKRLSTKLFRDVRGFKVLDSYYNGVQRLEQLGLAVPEELARFITIVAWPAMAADGIEERLDLEGFRWPDSDEADKELWRIWQANNLDEESQLGHLDALVYGRSYICVGTNADDELTPLVTVESPMELVHETDARTREVSAALRLYRGGPTGYDQLGTLYLPNVTVWLKKVRGRWVEDEDLGGRDEHDLGVVPVAPLINKARTADRSGFSEMQAVISLTDAAARALTNLQVAQETHAVPQRGVLGASKGDFVDRDGKPLTVWEAYFGSVWALENANAKTFQFDPSDLKNFETTLNLYARLASGVSALPPNYFGLQADDAASADAIRSREARLVKRCERRIRAFSGSWEQYNRLVLRFAGADVAQIESARRLETLWRDPATPTVAQKADATVKLVQAKILPVEAAWEDLGYSAARRGRLKQMVLEESARDPIAAFARETAGTGTPVDQPPVPAAV